MDQQAPSYRIRLARPDEVARVREIEDEAGTIFSGLGLIDEALDVSFPMDELARLVGMGQVWVACLEDGLAVGMVIASVREGAAYIEEIDVLPAHGRRGLGGRLLAEQEAQHGLRVQARVFMRRELAEVGPATAPDEKVARWPC